MKVFIKRFIARPLWLLLLLLSVGKMALGLPLYFAEKNSVCMASVEVCSQGNSLNPRQVQALESIGVSLTAYAQVSLAWELITSLIWAGVGLFIFLLRPNEWLAWIASTMMILFISAGDEMQIRSAYPSLGAAADLIFSLGNILLFLFIGLFPSGRFSPRWMRWYWLGMITVSLLPNDFWLSDPIIGNIVIFVYWISFLILGPFSQIYRYRNESTAVERQQTKWVVLGFAVFAGAVLIGSASMGLFPVTDLGQILYETFFFDIAGLLIPLSIGFSVLRYRLWDIDIIIRRTLQYSLVSGLLGLVYFGGVALMQGILTADRRPLTTGEAAVGGQPSAVVIVVTTLAIAALFTPLRRRIQDFIDRRFYRQKYNAEKALTEFAAAARSVTDLDTLTGKLLDTVGETLQPEQVSLWIKPTADDRHRTAVRHSWFS